MAEPDDDIDLEQAGKGVGSIGAVADKGLGAVVDDDVDLDDAGKGANHVDDGDAGTVDGVGDADLDKSLADDDIDIGQLATHEPDVDFDDIGAKSFGDHDVIGDDIDDDVTKGVHHHDDVGDFDDPDDPDDVDP